MNVVSRNNLGALTVFLLTGATVAFSQEVAPGAKEKVAEEVPAKPAASTPPKVERISPGVYRVANHILLDVKKREISFPAFCNQVTGLVEYALVTENGKTHESLFRTKVNPFNLQTTLLLARVQPAKGFVDNLWKEKREKMDVSASRLSILVSWKGKDGLESAPLEEMATNSSTKKPISPGSFIFTGSRFVEALFMAEQSGSIVAVYADDTAMINSGDHDSNNDDVWIASTEAMPPLDLPVTFTLKFPQNKVSSNQN
ncbi:MAG: YdjY domain-containing protein [Opitutales bacterium]